jgi:hypothetical protein
LIAGEGEQAWYLGEDYAFCERVRRCGFRVLADTAIRLWHVGSYRFGWEDAGRDMGRFGDYIYHLSDTMLEGRSPTSTPSSVAQASNDKTAPPH